ncbi:MAG: preprotein translocase subunit YajC [Bacteroidales bacterium]|nr:preprotein translocase subunit YajC [Bacteroidales bacterium]
MSTLIVLLQAAQQNAEGAVQGPGRFSGLLMIGLIILVFWLFFIRPQSKRAKEQKRFRDELKKGDPVVTIGGFHGKITEVKENTVMVSLAPGTEVEIEKSALVQNASQVGGQA